MVVSVTISVAVSVTMSVTVSMREAAVSVISLFTSLSENYFFVSDCFHFGSIEFCNISISMMVTMTMMVSMTVTMMVSMRMSSADMSMTSSRVLMVRNNGVAVIVISKLNEIVMTVVTTHWSR